MRERSPIHHLRRLVRVLFSEVTVSTEQRQSAANVNTASMEQLPTELLEQESGSLRSNLIYRAYQVLLEREPSSEEVALSISGIKPQTDTVDLISGILKSNEYQFIRFKQGFSATEGERKLIIRDLYRVLLGREPDVDGLNHYSGELANLSRAAAVIEWLQLSSEFKLREARLGIRQALERSFDVSQYLDLNADLRGAQIDALEHFIRHGVEEGRSTTNDAGHLDLNEDDWLEGLES